MFFKKHNGLRISRASLLIKDYIHKNPLKTSIRDTISAPKTSQPTKLPIVNVSNNLINWT